MQRRRVDGLQRLGERAHFVAQGFETLAEAFVERGRLYRAQAQQLVLQNGAVRFLNPNNNRVEDVAGLTGIDAFVPSPWWLGLRKGGKVLAYGSTGPFGYGGNAGRVDWVPKYVFELRRP